MARSLRSSRRKKNKQALRLRYKPIYDKRLQEIVKNMQKETEGATPEEVEANMQVVDPACEKMEDDSATTTTAEVQVEGGDDVTVVEKKKSQMPRVDVKKLTKFMSQSKLRTFKAKQKADKKRTKLGQKKKKTIKW